MIDPLYSIMAKYATINDKNEIYIRSNRFIEAARAIIEYHEMWTKAERVEIANNNEEGAAFVDPVLPPLLETDVLSIARVIDGQISEDCALPELGQLVNSWEISKLLASVALRVNQLIEAIDKINKTN